MNVIPTLALDLRTQEARRMVNIGLSSFDEGELDMLCDLLQSTTGANYTLGIGQTSDGRLCFQLVAGHVMEAGHA